MGIFNQLLVRFPKWIVSWVLFTIDAAIGFYVLDSIAIDPSVQFTNYSFFTIFIILQIFWCAVFWATNLYNGDAEVSRFGETETLIKVTFFIMTAGIFMLGIDISLGPLKAQGIIRYWILFTVLTPLRCPKFLPFFLFCPHLPLPSIIKATWLSLFIFVKSLFLFPC